MKFLDLAKIHVRSGSGGAGAASFRREKYVEHGGPDGGDGGRGGSVFAEAADELNTLIDYRYRRHAIADDGRPGMGRQRTGASGRDVVLKVPTGTEILDENCETVLFDLVATGQRELLARGGNGGFGNLRFRSSTNQAPRQANPGMPGVEQTLWLRYKMFADIGLVGLPNAGKSTFLASVSNARPRIADYPFTTLHPVLGMVVVNGNEFVLADIPGLIEGAHEGKGIGDRFLGHVERCRVLLHLVDATAEDVEEDYRTVLGEITAYGHGLAEKPRIVALSKIDALTPERLGEQCNRLAAARGPDAMAVSAASGHGIAPCLGAMAEIVLAARGARQDSMPWTP